ncbi:MAG: thiol:disulfide interchange protein [SAR86 cluster bacterium]|nr:thiol:disulfide interchange protein [SAR86 cluster bacterium]
MRLIIILLSNVIAVELYSSSLFENQNKIPVAEEVFKLSINNKDGEVFLSWNIKDGYYMYLQSIELKHNEKSIPFDILESKEELYTDEFFGETKILRDSFKIKAELNSLLNLLDVFIYYQGCSEAGFCYPVQKNKIY